MKNSGTNASLDRDSPDNSSYDCIGDTLVDLRGTELVTYRLYPNGGSG